MKSRLNLFVVMASALMITACSSVPMTSMWKMSKLNPLTMDPGGVSIAVVTHKAVEFSKDSVHIQMAYKTAAAKTSSTKKFPVQINDDALALDGADKKLFSGYQNADEATSTFSLSIVMSLMVNLLSTGCAIVRYFLRSKALILLTRTRGRIGLVI